MRAILMALAVVAALSSPSAADCVLGEDGDFPTARPEDVGLSSSELARLVQQLRSRAIDLHGLVILRHCRIVLELYTADVTRDHNHTIYSVTKSVLATLAGTLLKSGKLASLDVPVAQMMERPANVPPRHWDKATRIRLKDAMAMASGLRFRYDPYNHPIYDAPDRFALALQPDFVAPPGTRFTYSDGDVSIAGAAIAAAAGSDLLTYGQSALFKPLSFRNVDWSFRDAAGRYPGGWGLRLRAVDLAKLGQLYLQHGRWEGRTIIDPGFVEQAWQPSTAWPGYGLYWWLSPPQREVFTADGLTGQRIFVLPKQQIVIAATGNLSERQEETTYEALLSAVKAAVRGDEPVASDPDGFAELATQLASPLRGKPGTPVLEQDIPRPAKERPD